MLQKTQAAARRTRTAPAYNLPGSTHRKLTHIASNADGTTGTTIGAPPGYKQTRWQLAETPHQDRGPWWGALRPANKLTRWIAARGTECPWHTSLRQLNEPSTTQASQQSANRPGKSKMQNTVPHGPRTNANSLQDTQRRQRPRHPPPGSFTPAQIPAPRKPHQQTDDKTNNANSHAQLRRNRKRTHTQVTTANQPPRNTRVQPRITLLRRPTTTT